MSRDAEASHDVELPSLVVTTGKSQFRLRCHAAAWAKEYSGFVKLRRGHSPGYPGLLLLSATGADTAVKAVRATLFEPGVQAEFAMEVGEGVTRMTKATTGVDGKEVGYNAAIAKLASGAIHLVALARIPGLMPNLSDDHLWTELSGPRYTTPLLRPWTAWLKEAMAANGGIVVAQGYAASVGVLKTEPEALDELVSQGIRDRQLALSA